MIPILYEKDELAFTSNGLGRLRDCITCEVTEERNGIYECDFQYPVDGANYEDIICGRIVGVTHDDSDDVQPFDIVSYTRPIDGVVAFHCVHISYRLTGYTTSGTNINTLADALTMLSTTAPPMPFIFESNFTSTGYMSSADGTPRSVRQFLGGVEGSILDTYGGEYEWDRFRVLLKKARGEQRDFTIRYGVNMTSYEEESDYNGTYNQCVPYWTDGQNSVYGDVVSSGSPTYTGRDICMPLDLTDKFETIPTKAQLEAKALSYMQNTQTNLPRQNIKVDFIRLQDSPEYEQFESLLQCKLCDSIGVVFPLYGMQGNFKIVRTVYDVLGERFTEMELGALSVSLSEALGIDQMGGGNYLGGGITELVAGDGITITGSGDSRTIVANGYFGGDIYLLNGEYLQMKDSGGTYRNAVTYNSSNQFTFGNGSYTSSTGGSYFDGNSVNLRYKTNLTFNNNTFQNMFTVTTASYTQASTASGANNGGTVTATNSGWTPLGIVGWTASGGTNPSNANVYRCYLSARSSGSATVTIRSSNAGTSAMAPVFTIYILWVRNT